VFFLYLRLLRLFRLEKFIRIVCRTKRWPMRLIRGLRELRMRRRRQISLLLMFRRSLRMFRGLRLRFRSGLTIIDASCVILFNLGLV
jgi:hypothetical protein